MDLRGGLSPILGLLLLSALWAAGWLLTDLFPHSGTRSVPIPLGQTILFSAFAVIALSICLVRKYEFPKGRRAFTWSAIGVGFFVIPTCAVAFAQGRVSNFDQVAVLCLTPFFAVVLEPYIHDNAPRGARAGLPAALTAIAGVLCFFPLEPPGSLDAGAALLFLVGAAVEIAATNCVAVKLAGADPKLPGLPFAVHASGASAICFAVIASTIPVEAWESTPLSMYLLRLFLIDIPGLFLLFWLLHRLAASRMTARFLLAPLFASLLSLALEQTLPTPRALLGIVLLASGSGWLVFAPAERKTEDRISIRQ